MSKDCKVSPASARWSITCSRMNFVPAVLKRWISVGLDWNGPSQTPSLSRSQRYFNWDGLSCASVLDDASKTTSVKVVAPLGGATEKRATGAVFVAPSRAGCANDRTCVVVPEGTVAYTRLPCTPTNFPEPGVEKLPISRWLVKL